MLLIIISAIPVSIFIYTVLAMILSIPSSKIYSNINQAYKQNIIKNDNFAWFNIIADKLQKYVPIGLAKEIKLNKLLNSAHVNESARLFTTKQILTFALICIAGLPIMLITPWLYILPFIFAILFAIGKRGDLEKKSKEEQFLIQREAPRLIETVAHSIRTNRNIINIFDNYIKNYESSYLSKELSKTVADMRTGSQEVALQRFEQRMNNTLISQFVRGILASMGGEDMTLFFNDLVLKIAAVRRQHLTEQALRIKPKITRMSTTRAMMAIGVLITVLVASVLQINVF